jgi:hypothetical protein
MLIVWPEKIMKEWLQKEVVQGKKILLFTWENDEGIWKRSLITRGDVEIKWGQFKSSQAIFNLIDNCWKNVRV